MPLKKIAAFDQELRDIRHQIHQHPELGFEEQKTSALVAAKLTEWGYEVHRGLAKTGVVGVLKAGAGSKRLGFRADMDALPLQENTGKPWSSQVPDRMHACGHDGHTTMLLGAAKYLAETKNFNGTLHLIFQPAEEMLNGGDVMVREGLFDRFPCDAIFAMHNMPGYPLGQLVFQHGPFLASMDQFQVTVRGKGGHGAMPQYTIDPVVIASSITMALQTIVARNVNPQEAAVVTVGSIQAGHAANVIPEYAEMKISMRSLNRDVREMMKRRITEVVEAQAKSFGATAKVQYITGTPVLMNAETETRFAYEVAEKLFGKDGVRYGAPPLMGSEDFAFMLDAHPQGSYMFIGNGDEPGGCMVHNEGYDFNDANLARGAAYWSALAEAYLK